MPAPEKLYFGIPHRWKRLQTWIRVIGLPAYVLRVCRDKFAGTISEYTLQPKCLEEPLVVRGGSSDIEVFRQVFVDREYGTLDALQGVGLVVDCGANAGYSSAFFLCQHPDCHVVAVEPDPDNFAMLRRNLEPYGDRAEPIHAGVWSHPAQLVMMGRDYHDGRHWSRQVRECKQGEAAQVEGVDMGTILAASGFERISLLKLDVEGAEAIIFSGPCQAWLDKVDAIAIELHDDSGFGVVSEVFLSAIDGRGFDLSRHGELTFCRRSEG